MKLAIAALAVAFSFTLACAGTASDGTVGPQGPQGPVAPAAPAGASTLGPTNGGRITIKRTRYVGADGSATTPYENSYRDEKLNVDCAITSASDGVMRCLPSSVGVAVLGYFADNGCTTPLAILTGVSPCSPPPYVVQYAAPQACTGTTSAHVLSVGPQLSMTAAIYVGTPGKCTAIAQTPSFRYFTTGAEVAASNFVAFTQQTL